MAITGTRPLPAQTTCPHCWHEFAPQDVLFVAAHTDLLGDLRLGPNAMMRFRPSRFDLRGHALDARGLTCRHVACPRCHLSMPEEMLATPALFASILGTPSCGKSFFLAAMTWELRRQLPAEFGLTFTDADPTFNKLLNSYENSLFMRAHDAEPVDVGGLIPKTEDRGLADLYATVRYGNQAVTYPRPFLFRLAPGKGHPSTDPAAAARTLCLYDNAGEAFQPDGDSTALPTTHHLARAQFLMYLFDPTQNPGFRAAFKDVTGRDLPPIAPSRQDVVLREAEARIKSLLMLDAQDKYDRPLLVLLTKYDTWRDLAPRAGDGVVRRQAGKLAELDADAVKAGSAALRALLERTCGEVVTAAEDFASRVTYLPVGALGRPPVWNPAKGAYCLAPGPITPVGVTVPFVLGLQQSMPDLVAKPRRVAAHTPAPAPARRRP